MSTNVRLGSPFNEEVILTLDQDFIRKNSPIGTYKLLFSDWYKFNVQQRIHLNYVEQLGLATTSVLAGGLVCPHIGIGIGLTHIIARLLYGFFYERKGAANKIRMISAALGYIANLVGLGFFLRHFFFK